MHPEERGGEEESESLSEGFGEESKANRVHLDSFAFCGGGGGDDSGEAAEAPTCFVFAAAGDVPDLGRRCRRRCVG